jgi:hypothetical protein
VQGCYADHKAMSDHTAHQEAVPEVQVSGGVMLHLQGRLQEAGPGPSSSAGLPR